MNHKLFITGGHVTPALATIDVLRAQHADWEIVFIGRKHALEGVPTVSEEYRLITAKHVRFVSIIAGRLKREGGVAALAPLVKVPVGFIQALWFVGTEKPDVIVSFGGYVALPVVIAGWLLRVPVVTHEQTRKPGLANRIIARISQRTCVSFPDRSTGLSGTLVYTGLPMRKSVFHPPASLSFAFPKEKRPLVLIVGGSTGAKSINVVVYEALPGLLRIYTVIHQVGRLSFEKAKVIKNQLGRDRRYYIPVPYLSESDYSWALRNARLVIGRSGANTVMEIAARGKVALFIPLPWAAENEQYYNALYLKDAGSAVILPQDQLSPAFLLDAVTKILAEYEYRTRVAERIAEHIPRDGSSKLTHVIEDMVH